MREDAEHSVTEKIVLAMPLASVILAHAGIQRLVIDPSSIIQRHPRACGDPE